MPEQIPLGFHPAPNYSLESFIASGTNMEAWSAIGHDAHWPDNILCLYGAKGTGKSHLGHIWKSRRKAIQIMASAPPKPDTLTGATVWLDNASQTDEEYLFNLINRVLNREVPALLMADRRSPDQWDVELRDLRSRLAAVRCIGIAPPDDSLLEAVYFKLFRDRGLEVGPALITFLMKNGDRSIATAQKVVEELDQKAFEQSASLNRNFAKKVLFEQGEFKF